MKKLNGHLKNAAFSAGEKLQGIMLESEETRNAGDDAPYFSKAGKVTLGAIGLAGVGLLVSAGGKRDVKNDIDNAREEGRSFTFKPIKRALARLSGILMGVLAVEALYNGKDSYVGKFTERIMTERAEAKNQENVIRK